MTRTGAAARPDLEERTQNLLEWAELHSKLLTIIAVAASQNAFIARCPRSPFAGPATPAPSAPVGQEGTADGTWPRPRLSRARG